jgi:hypothetical protein
VPLWRFLGAAGIRSAFITVPFTYPPEPIAGLLVTGWGGPQRPEILPALARDRIFAAHPDLVTAQSPTGWWKELDAFTRKLIDHVDEVADVCLLAMELEPSLGLLCVDFMSSDIAGHLTWLTPLRVRLSTLAARVTAQGLSPNRRGRVELVAGPPFESTAPLERAGQVQYRDGCSQRR